MYLNVGEVRSGTLTNEPSLYRPATDTFARSVVRTFGCGRREVVPWHVHNIVAGFLRVMPEWFLQYTGRLKLKELAKEIGVSVGR